MSAEDVFSSQDVVDNQPVTIKVMDTFDQVLITPILNINVNDPNIYWVTMESITFQGRPGEQRALPVVGRRLPGGLQHRQQGQFLRLPAVPADPEPAQQDLPASNSHHPAGQQAGHGKIQARFPV